MRERVFFKTFGCRTNIFDTQVMISNLKDFKVTEDIEDADTIVINSCTVTNSADTNGRQFINRVKRDYPEKRVLFTGCGVRTVGKSLFEQGVIHSGFGHPEKERVEDFLKDKNRLFKIGDLKHIDSTVVDKFVGKSRAFIKIQEGCNFKCSYCIIPTVRGRSRSYREETILQQVQILADSGFKEFILTGTNIGSYGGSRNSLARLLKKISQVKGVQRIRLGSVEPSQIGEEFFELLDEEWLGRYLHIAIQYSDDRMLKIMNRKNRVESDLKLFNTLSEKGYALGTDYIVGHPGESEEIFGSALQRLQEYPLTHIHLFRYSKRDGTPSATMSEINGSIVKERFQTIETLINSKSANFRDSIKQPLKVLVEKRGNSGLFEGYDQYFYPVYIESSNSLEGQYIEIKDYNWRDFQDV